MRYNTILMKDLNFQKTILSNNIPLYVMNLPHTQSVAVGVLVKAGTRDEMWPGEAGVAHALEHMSFQGTENFPTSKDVSAYLEEIGGSLNAWTSEEGTFYHNRVPVAHKERGFRILGEMLRVPLIPAGKISVEMKNIIEELRMYLDDPDGLLWILNQKFLFGGHPLGKNSLGTIEALSAFGQDHFFEFRKRYYHSANLTVLVVGNITLDEAVRESEENFTGMEAREENVRDFVPLTGDPERELIHRKELEQVHIALTAPLGRASEKSSKSMVMFSIMLSGGMSFPLFQEVRDKRGLCYAISANTTRNSDVGEFSIAIGTDPKRYREAIDVSMGLIEKSKNDEDLLQKAKDLALGNLALQFEHTGGILRIAASSALIDGAPKGYDEYVQDIEEITINDVVSAVDTYLRPEQVRRVLLAPKGLKT